MSDSIPNANKTATNLIYRHDGVVLMKAEADCIGGINMSGTLSLVEYGVETPRRIFCIEWRPYEGIFLTNDGQYQGNWSVDMTSLAVAEYRTDITINNTSRCSTAGQIWPEALMGIESRYHGLVMRLLRAGECTIHSEFFFQQGTAHKFIYHMRQLKIIEPLDKLPHKNNDVSEYITLGFGARQENVSDQTSAECNGGTLPVNSGTLIGLEDSRSFSLDSQMRESSLNNSPINSEDMLMSEDDMEEMEMVLQNYQPCGSPSSSTSLVTRMCAITMNNIDKQIVNMLPERTIVLRGAPLNGAQWLEFHTIAGRVSDPRLITRIIFRGGIEPQLRGEVWKYYLNYYNWHDTFEDRQEEQRLKNLEYYSMRSQWATMTKTQEHNFAGFRLRKLRIEHDIRRISSTVDFSICKDNKNIEKMQDILMTYMMYKFDFGYMYGMADLLIPILTVQQNEVDAFWCFVGFMDLIRANFVRGEMRTLFNQLLEYTNPRLFNYMLMHNLETEIFSSIHWILMWSIHVIELEDVLKMWECLLTEMPGPSFIYFIAIAVLDQETDIIIENNYNAEELKNHFYELTKDMDLQCTLETAEEIYMQVKMVKNLPFDIYQMIIQPFIMRGN